jgi:formate hydrogenlyase subunit 3/multisubunit Na+/H+ antiporter MnhD subunit
VSPRAKPILLLAPLVLSAAVIVSIGVGAELVFPIAIEAARQLIHPEAYIQAVLGVPR